MSINFFTTCGTKHVSFEGHSVAVEVVGGSTRVGHSICIRAFVHVGHTRSLSVHVAHYHMMCAYVTERGTISYYIMCMKGDPVLSV